MTFLKTTAHKLGESPGGRYAQNPRWPPLETEKTISRLILALQLCVIPVSQCFFGVRNTFLKSFLGFNYIFSVILPCDMVVFLLYTVTIQQFFGINISHGSVATYLRCGGIFDNHFIANFILNVVIKEL